MSAVRVSSLRVGVALGAGDLLRSLVVHEALDVGVAVDAGQQGTVNGMPELGLVDVEADRLAIHIRGERLVGVARETIGIFQLLRRVES